MGKTGLKEKQEASTATMVRLGYLVPSNEEEFDLFEAQYASYDFKLANLVLDPHELILSQLNDCISIKNDTAPTIKHLFFKRVVLAAEIVSQLHVEPTFGHVKFQKLVFLCEQASNLRLEHLYVKQVAGPFDNKFMHTIDTELKKQKWFDVEKVHTSTSYRFKYIPLENYQNHRKYFDNYFSNDSVKIQWLIDTFRKQKTDNVELIATLFACWLEIINQPVYNEDLLIKKFYDWSDAKKKFRPAQVVEAIQWMKRNELTPV